MNDHFPEWDDPLLERYYLRCIIDEQALVGEGEWKKFYEDYTYVPGVYRITCEYPIEDRDGVKHRVIYIGETGSKFQGGLGHRIANYISIPGKLDYRSNRSTNKRVRKTVHTEVKDKKQGQIILECLHPTKKGTKECKWIEAKLLSNYKKIHGSLPPDNWQKRDPSNYVVKEPCKLYRLVDDLLKDS